MACIATTDRIEAAKHIIITRDERDEDSMRDIFKKIVYAMFDGRLIRRGEPGGIYLTYDDGPHPENTLQLLQVLAKYDAKATFFMVGASMEEHPEIVSAVIAAGHSIGFHSHQHRSTWKISFAEFRSDLAQAKSLSRKFSYPMKIYRPPFGHLSLASLLWLLLGGWRVVMWSLDCGDSQDSPEQVRQNLVPSGISDGEIILLHDDYQSAVDILETALHGFQQAGFKCLAL